MHHDRLPQVVLITGASSGFGLLTAQSLARAGHTVVAGMRATTERNASVVADLARLATVEGLRLSAVELDVQSQASADAALAEVSRQHGRLDVIVHNAGHMVSGPAEAFTPEQLTALYDVNVVGTQRVNRAALPLLREQGSGLLVWVGSSSTRGGHPPFLAPYFAAKAPWTRWPKATPANSSASASTPRSWFPEPSPPGRTTSPTPGAPRTRPPRQRTGRCTGNCWATCPSAWPPWSQPTRRTVRRRRDRARGRSPAGQRPFRTHVDPSRDGSEVVSAVADRIRAEFYRRVGLESLLPSNAAL